MATGGRLCAADLGRGAAHERAAPGPPAGGPARPRRPRRTRPAGARGAALWRRPRQRGQSRRPSVPRQPGRRRRRLRPVGTGRLLPAARAGGALDRCRCSGTGRSTPPPSTPGTAPCCRPGLAARRRRDRAAGAGRSARLRGRHLRDRAADPVARGRDADPALSGRGRCARLVAHDAPGACQPDPRRDRRRRRGARRSTLRHCSRGARRPSSASSRRRSPSASPPLWPRAMPPGASAGSRRGRSTRHGHRMRSSACATSRCSAARRPPSSRGPARIPCPACLPSWPMPKASSSARRCTTAWGHRCSSA